MQHLSVTSVSVLLGLLSTCTSASPVAPERRCVSFTSPQSTISAQQAWNVSGEVQHCVRTDCCVGIFRTDNEKTSPQFLGCTIEETSCPEMFCHQIKQDPNYIRCVCNSDFCNSNISFNQPDKQTQQPHTAATFTDQLKARVPEVSLVTAGALIFLLSVVTLTVLKWKHLLKRCEKAETLKCCHLNGVVASPSDFSENSDIDLVNVELLEVVAGGQFACVWQGNFQGSSVALKVFHATLRHEFSKERDIYTLPLMTHPGIVQFLGAGRKGGAFVLVLELATRGSLNVFLSRTVCDWPSTVKLALTLTEGLAYLHTDLHKNGVYKPAIVHCDLSSNNVLVKADGSCALCDLGCSMVLQHSVGLHGQWRMEERVQMGTLRYRSPELLDGYVNLSSGHCLLQADVYSAGLLLWEMLTRCSDLYKDSPVPAHLFPYEAELGPSPSREALLDFVSEKRGRPSVPAHWTQVLQGSLCELLEDCWDQDADARLTAESAANRVASLPSQLKSRSSDSSV